MSRIKILDCTLRDGGYVNDWNFGKYAISNIYSRLIDSNIDIIEVGFLNESYPFDLNRSIVPHSKYLAQVFQAKTEKKALLVAMVILGECPNENIGNCSETFVDGIRVVFKKKDMEEAFILANQLKEKGYIIFLQPASVTDYSDRDMLNLIDKANEIDPYVLYIVDSYGLMHKDKAKNYFNLMNNNLKKEIAIGFHSHNNFQLSYATALDIIDITTNRNIIIDSSLFGMGKGTGNLNTELITDYLNKNYGANYDVLQILEIIDLEILKIKEIFSWGYSLNGFIAASNDCHPTYVKHLIDKKTIPVKSINQILFRLPQDKKTSFDKKLIEDLYYKFQCNDIDDSNTYKLLAVAMEGRNVLLLAPGSSLVKEKIIIDKYIKDTNPVIISINHNPESFNLDFIFISNAKRYSQMISFLENHDEEVKIVATTNITPINNTVDYFFNYCNLLVDGDTNIISDNATLMMIKALKIMGLKQVSIAGFDGFSDELKGNYVDNYLSYNSNKNTQKQNILITEAVKQVSNDIELNFITKSMYTEN